MVQPPFSEHVKTNIGRIFLNLLEKQFPPPLSLPQNLQQKHCEDQLQLYAEHGSDSIKAQQDGLSIQKHQCTSSLQLSKRGGVSSKWRLS